MGTRWGGEAPARALLWGAAAVGVLCALAGPALASDRVTVNHTDTYVDPNLSAAFVTTPNLCTEPIGTQGTSPDGCNALGDAAVLAATGSGPDVYFEPQGSYLEAKNAFVPTNAGNPVGNTGYAPIFSQHKYDLFGRSGDSMGPLTREEHLFITTLGPTVPGITNPQTDPGGDVYFQYAAVLLTTPSAGPGSSTITRDGFTFKIADLTWWVRQTGLTTGGRDMMETWGSTTYPFSLLWPSLSDDQKVTFFVSFSGQLDAAQPTACSGAGVPSQLQANCGLRDQWVDQTVVGYVDSWASLGGDGHFAQNFRSQIGYNPNAAILDSGTEVYADFRLQQSVELSGAFTTEATDPGDLTSPGDNQDFVAGRQTFEQTIATDSVPDAGFLRFPGSLGQMVSQDVNGYLFNCLNCDTATTEALGQTHDFTPAKLELTFMPYSAGWQTVPTVTHAP